MCLCGDVLYIQIKKWYVKFGATGSLTVAPEYLGGLLTLNLLSAAPPPFPPKKKASPPVGFTWINTVNNIATEAF